MKQETITFQEFKSWLTGLIVGKGGSLPDLDDWKQIKEMIDKVVPDKETIPMPYPVMEPFVPQRQEWTPNTTYPNPNVWYTSSNGTDFNVNTTLDNATTSLGAVTESAIQLDLDWNNDLEDALQEMIRSR